MSVVIVFVLVVIGLAGWWLVQQRILSKPWLEVGSAPVGGPAATPQPPQRVALVVFLAVVGALFALFASAYFMRMEYADWQPLALPRIVWVNTAMLVLASVALQSAVTAARRFEIDTVRIGVATAGVATLAFLAGQLLAWRELVEAGQIVTAGPANSFFYLLTAVHGLHILGGLVALGRTTATAWSDDARPARLRLRVELCATYWHFLLFVWLGIMVLLAGWANEFIAICRQLLT